MARLDKPKRSGFACSDFEEFPVWTWDDETETHLPIAEEHPFADEYGTVFIRAKLTAEGHTFDGYLIGGSSFFGFGVFAEKHEFVFNLNIPELNRVLIADLSRRTGIAFSAFFPVAYTSDVRLADGLPISGSLSP